MKISPSALIRAALCAVLSLAAQQALAAAYVFPGTLPTGCSGSAGSYTCSALTLGYNDTLTIGSPTPATITINGAFSTNNAQINNGGAASNLRLVVNGAMTVGYQARIIANVSATSINDPNGQVTFGGTLTTTTGSIAIGYGSTVAGTITSTSGAIGLAGTVQAAGQVSCSCTLTVGFQARITGNVRATRVTDSSGQVTFGGSVTTTTGGLALGYASTVAGGVSSTSGPINLGGTSRVQQCVQTTGSATLTLGYGSVVTSGLCCGALGACSSSCVVNSSGGAMPALCATPPPSPSLPGKFNAFDTSTAAGSLSGAIRTKVSGTAFSLSLAAINTAGTGLASAFAGTVRVELLNASNNTGALNASTGCRSSWALASGTSSSTLSFAASDGGRKDMAFTVANAWRDVRVRVSYPATGTATAVGCSTDNFAVRPASFASFRVSDATLLTAGTTRTLSNTALTGGAVHKAGRPFTVRATAVNGAAATTTNYTGTPTAFVSACGGPACSATLGTLSFAATAAAGVVNTTTASYSEAGAFNLQLVDSSFAAVDAADGSTPTEMSISSPSLSVGRFVPDHFDVVSLVTPVLRTFNSSTCPTRSFTYLGQPFGYSIAPQATVIARNAAGATTTNYPNAKLSALVKTQAYTPLATATPGIDSSTATLPTLTASGSGVAVLTAQSSDTLRGVRSTTTPVAPYNASINLTWRVTDSSETGSGNGTITTPVPLSFTNIAFDQGNEMRYGLLQLGSAYGSELVSLAMPVEAQYWNGSHFATNAADHCTQLSASAVALGTYRANLNACETAPGVPTIALSSGRAILRMLPPGSGNSGSADVTLNLGTVAAGQQCASIGAAATPATTANQPWLQRKGPAAATYTVNPSARVSFGPYRSPVIHWREVY